jgi:hypothetical protein
MAVLQVVNGMSSYFTLELDTTPPIVEIHAPNYVINGHYLEFKVSANEKIDPGRFIAQAIDNGSNRYPIILNWEEDEQLFSGLIDTYGFVDGITNIEVTLFDNVHNQSTATKALKVYKSISEIKLTTKKYENTINIKSRVNTIKSKMRKNTIIPFVRINSVFVLKRSHVIKFKVGE